MRRALIALAAIAGAAAAWPGAAGAFSVTVTPPADPAEERAVTIIVSGVADTQMGLTVLRRPAGGQDCGASHGVDIGGEQIGRFAIKAVNGAFSEPLSFTPQEPGQVLICAWLQNQLGDPVARARATPITLTVRGNAATVGLSGPAAPPRAGEVAVLGASVQSEVSRVLSVSAMPAKTPGDTSPCASSEKTRVGRFTSIGVTSRFSGASSESRTWDTPSSPAAGGVWLVCAWVQEGDSDVTAEAQAAMFLTIVPTVRCERAQRRAAAARKALRRGQRRYKRARRLAAKPASSRVRSTRRLAKIRARRAVDDARKLVAKSSKKMAGACD